MGHSNPSVNQSTKLDPFTGVRPGCSDPSMIWTPRGQFQATHVTCGDFDTEVEAVQAFDELAPDDLFEVHSEVPGVLRWPLHGQKRNAGVRIDRLLIPKPRALEQGWQHGIIGVECKRSGEKAGRSINQMLDYLRSTFIVDGEWVQLGYAVLWPYLGPTGGPLESIFHGQRLGFAHPTDDGMAMRRTNAYGPFDLLSGSTLFGYRAGEAVVSTKVGSR